MTMGKSERQHDVGSRINIELGTQLFIEIDGLVGRLKSHLIGMEPGKYLIIKTPGGPMGVSGDLNPEHSMRIYYVSHGRVLGFEAKILNFIANPTSMIFLSYPVALTEKDIRTADRADCYITCKVKIAGKEKEGTVVDISTAGCRCLIRSWKEEASPVKEDAPVEIEMELPEQGKMVVNGIVSNLSEYHSALKAGIKFSDMDETAEEQLKNFILANQ